MICWCSDCRSMEIKGPTVAGGRTRRLLALTTREARIVCDVMCDVDVGLSAPRYLWLYAGGRKVPIGAANAEHFPIPEHRRPEGKGERKSPQSAFLGSWVCGCGTLGIHAFSWTVGTCWPLGPLSQPSHHGDTVQHRKTVIKELGNPTSTHL